MKEMEKDKDTPSLSFSLLLSLPVYCVFVFPISISDTPIITQPYSSLPSLPPSLALKLNQTH